MTYPSSNKPLDPNSYAARLVAAQYATREQPIDPQLLRRPTDVHRDAVRARLLRDGLDLEKAERGGLHRLLRMLPEDGDVAEDAKAIMSSQPGWFEPAAPSTVSALIAAFESGQTRGTPGS